MLDSSDTSVASLFQGGPGLVSTAGLSTAKVQVVAQVLQQIVEVYRNELSQKEIPSQLNHRTS